MCVQCRRLEKEAGDEAKRLLALDINPASYPDWVDTYLRRLDAGCPEAKSIPEGSGTDPLGGRTLSA